jgi:hypothetical protein
MKTKVFEVILHRLPSSKSPASALEDQINDFLERHPKLELVASHINTVIMPPEPNAMPRTEESSIVLFCTIFYTELSDGAPV